MQQVSPLDLTLLRQAIALSADSRARGHHPFAALVADENGKVIASAGNNDFFVKVSPDGSRFMT